MKIMTAGQGVVALESFIAFRSVMILPFRPKKPRKFSLDIEFTDLIFTIKQTYNLLTIHFIVT